MGCRKQVRHDGPMGIIPSFLQPLRTQRILRRLTTMHDHLTIQPFTITCPPVESSHEAGGDDLQFTICALYNSHPTIQPFFFGHAVSWPCGTVVNHLTNPSTLQLFQPFSTLFNPSIFYRNPHLHLIGATVVPCIVRNGYHGPALLFCPLGQKSRTRNGYYPVQHPGGKGSLQLSGVG